jgi:hypothetical protein
LIPVAPSEVVENGQILTPEQGTILVSENYAGYNLANVFSQEFDFFTLFSQVYAFDGSFIWLVPTSAGVASGPIQKVAPAQGLRLVATSPEVAYFVSNYDNAIFAFNGGRSLQKVIRMNRKAEVEYGVYNVEENALHLITEDSLIILRDNVVTENARPYTGDIKLYSTVNGIIYGQGAKWKSLQYRSDVFTAGTTTVVPLTLQTAFVGPMDNQWFKTPQYMIYLQEPTLSGTLTLEISYHWIDQDDSGFETKTISLTVDDFDSEGYSRVRYIPTKDSVVGNSLQIDCDTKVIILDVVQYFQPMGPALVPDTRTAVEGT